MIGQSETEVLAKEYGVSLKNWREGQCAILGQDGFKYIEDTRAMGITWRKEYRELLSGDCYMSERTYNHLTGENVDVLPELFVRS